MEFMNDKVQVSYTLMKRT